MSKYIDGCTVRTARKLYQCYGAKKRWRPPSCKETINPGDTYVEYTGDVGAYESGYRHCLSCAEVNLAIPHSPQHS